MAFASLSHLLIKNQIMSCRSVTVYSQEAGDATVTVYLGDVSLCVTHSTDLIRSHLDSAGRFWLNQEARIKVWAVLNPLPAVWDLLSFSPYYSPLFTGHIITALLLLGLIFSVFPMCTDSFLSYLLTLSSPAFLPEFILFLMECLLWISSLSSSLHSPPAINNPMHPTFCSHGEMNNWNSKGRHVVGIRHFLIPSKHREHFVVSWAKGWVTANYFQRGESWGWVDQQRIEKWSVLIMNVRCWMGMRSLSPVQRCEPWSPNYSMGESDRVYWPVVPAECFSVRFHLPNQISRILSSCLLNVLQWQFSC